MGSASYHTILCVFFLTEALWVGVRVRVLVLVVGLVIPGSWCATSNARFGISQKLIN